MDRRSFILSLIGGMAAASVGAVAVSEAAQTTSVPAAGLKPAAPDLATAPAPAAAAIDETDAEFSQYYRRRRGYGYRRDYGYRRRYMRRPDRRARPYSQR